MRAPEITVISLGWGVQSFTLVAMSALGELPPVYAAIHADTTHEHKATYEFAAKWSEWLSDHDMRVVTVSDERAARAVYQDDGRKGEVMAPFFTLSPKGKTGVLNRVCTNRWKIQPMRRWISQELHALGHAKHPGAAEQWIGISVDEIERARPSDVQYVMNRFPLLEKRMTRIDCVKWLTDHGLEVPPKSSCVFCPYHSASEWRRLKHEGADWDRAILVDERVRDARHNARIPVDVFVHPARIPLVDVDLKTPEEAGQLRLEMDECSGTCFL